MKYIYNKALNQVREYDGHTFPVSGDHSWEDGQVLVEGKDFKFQYGHGGYLYNDGTPPPLVAVPLPVIKQENEAQEQMWENLLAEIGYKGEHTGNAMAFLKEKYPITRKNQTNK